MSYRSECRLAFVLCFAMPSCEVLSCPVCSVSSLNVKYFLSVGKLDRCVKTKNPPNSLRNPSSYIKLSLSVGSRPSGHDFHSVIFDIHEREASWRPGARGGKETLGLPEFLEPKSMISCGNGIITVSVCVCVLELCVIVSFVHKINTPTPTIEIEMHKYTQSIYVYIYLHLSPL